MRIPYRNKLMIKKILRILGFALVALVILIGAIVIYADSKIVYDRNGAHLSNEAPTMPTATQSADENTDLQPPEIIYVEGTQEDLTLAEMGGFYITTEMLQTPEKVLQQLRSLDAPCAVMMELKSIFGNFYYSTAIDGAKTASVDVGIVDEIIEYLRENNFYMIASVAAFADNQFALANQPQGLALRNGALWMDERGCYWLDPASQTVISYLVQITRELATLGFNEVAFSDFRFPVSNNIHYESDLTGQELVQEAATQLTGFFRGSNVMISFCVSGTEFPSEACSGRIYVTEVDGSQIERYVQAYGTNLTELVFLASSRDTRFEELALLRPLMSQ